jgi:dihydrofolate reductase
MRKLIVSEFVSLDGVMEAPGGEPEYRHTGWVFPFHTSEQEQYKLEEARDSEALVLGRKTYDGFAAAWPQRSGEFADQFNSMPKYVVSSTLKDPEWNNTTVLDGLDAVRELRDGDGGTLMVQGSATLVHALLENDLVDVLRLMVFPVILGSGKRVFPETPDKTTMRLAGSRTFESGVQVCDYEAVR